MLEGNGCEGEQANSRGKRPCLALIATAKHQPSASVVPFEPLTLEAEGMRVLESNGLKGDRRTGVETYCLALISTAKHQPQRVSCSVLSSDARP